MIKKNIFSRKELSLFLQEKKIFLSKMHGQNFLINFNILEKIFSIINYQNDDLLIEIGGGLGHLTDFFIQKNNFKKLIIFEIDKKLSQILEDRFLFLKTKINFEIFHQDYLKWNLKFFLKKELMEHNSYSSVYIIGNLPYSCVGRILRSFIDNSKYINKAYITIQKELALRILALPNNKSYGLLSVLMQTFSSPQYVFKIPRGFFFPIPKVDSVFLSLNFEMHLKSEVRDIDFFIKFVKLLFSFRRKKILKVLKIYKWKVEILEKIPKFFLEKQAESLTKEQIIELSNLIYNITYLN